MTRSKKVYEGKGWSFRPAGAEMEAKAAESVPPGEQRIRIRSESRARGKRVTVLSGFRLSPEELRALAGALKKELGAGGSCEEDRIELQGNRGEEAKERLRTRGFAVS